MPDSRWRPVFASEKGLNFSLDGLDPSFAATSSLKSQTREEKIKKEQNKGRWECKDMLLTVVPPIVLFPEMRSSLGKTASRSSFQRDWDPLGARYSSPRPLLMGLLFPGLKNLARMPACMTAEGSLLVQTMCRSENLPKCPHRRYEGVEGSRYDSLYVRVL